MPKNQTMRITGGTLSRRRFLIPPMVDEGSVRPTPDRVREALFSMLQYDLKDALVLDLFAGSGAHGFESISRGAREVVFVEKDYRVAAVIKQNIADLGVEDHATIEINDAVRVITKGMNRRFDVIFVDPPYALKLDQDFFRLLYDHVADDGVVVYRCFKKESPLIDERWSIDRDRVYGGTRVFLLRRVLTSESTEPTNPV